MVSACEYFSEGLGRSEKISLKYLPQKSCISLKNNLGGNCFKFLEHSQFKWHIFSLPSTLQMVELPHITKKCKTVTSRSPTKASALLRKSHSEKIWHFGTRKTVSRPHLPLSHKNIVMLKKEFFPLKKYLWVTLNHPILIFSSFKERN